MLCVVLDGVGVVCCCCWLMVGVCRALFVLVVCSVMFLLLLRVAVCCVLCAVG